MRLPSANNEVEAGLFSQISQTLVQLIIVATLASCATAPQTKVLLESQPRILPQASSVERLPFYPQEAYQCGPAALATVLTHSGINVAPESLVSDLFIPDKQGTFQVEILAASRARGRIAHEVAGSLENLLREVSAGNPVLVMQNLALNAFPQWHFAVVKGFDLHNGQLILNSGPLENYALDLSTFERTWARADYWAITVLPPEQIPITATPDSYLSSLWDFEQTSQSQSAIAVAYQSAVHKWPENTNLRMALANHQLTHQDYDAARQNYQRILSHSPEYAPAHNNLAYAYVAMNNLSAASSHAKLAVRYGQDRAPTYQATLEEIQAFGNRE